LLDDEIYLKYLHKIKDINVKFFAVKVFKIKSLLVDISEMPKPTAEFPIS